MDFEVIPLNVKCFIDAAEELLRHDETLLALDLLSKGIPGFYRDNPPPEVTALKREILKRFATFNHLVHSPAGFEVYPEEVPTSLRAILILKEVERLNVNGLTPHLVDFGPGDYWLYYLLKNKKCSFTYRHISINQAAKLKGKDIVQSEDPLDRPIIFVACEIIEHLFDEREIVAEMMRVPRIPDAVHISTPCYTFGTWVKHWKDIGDIGHLRTYTPAEFQTKTRELFPDFDQYVYVSKMLHARLVNKNTVYQSMKEQISV